METAPTRIETIGGSEVLVVERYDRRATTAGAIERAHREDTAQALGRAREYQDEGGQHCTKSARCTGSTAWQWQRFP